MAGAGIRDILIEGPWRHRDIAANGIRFHLALGLSYTPDRPLVLLLHGFGEHWWAWRHQIPALDAAGVAVAAMDLRGYGASDKPPRGYDPETTAADVSGVIRSLGHRRAILVGHDWGGMAAWSTAAFASDQVAGLVSVAVPHPRAFPWSRMLGHLVFCQLPLLPERRIRADDGAYIEELLRRRAAPGGDFPSRQDARIYRDALRLWPSTRCALEYQRVFVRDQMRAAGGTYRKALRVPVAGPLLSVHGELDALVPLSSMAAASDYVRGGHELVSLPRVGHFPPEEAPDAFNEVIIRWLAYDTKTKPGQAA